jgi:hypothetical protein
MEVGFANARMYFSTSRVKDSDIMSCSLMEKRHFLVIIIPVQIWATQFNLKKDLIYSVYILVRNK